MSRVRAPTPFDVCGPLPQRRHRARGERRDRQDVHDRGARRALRRRGHAAGPDPARDVHADGDRRAARPRPRAARAHRAGPRARAGGRAADRRATRSSRCSPTGSPAEVRERHDRLVRAIARFDAATIATTHGFCQEVLGGLGIVGDVETDMTFVEDPADLIEEVVDDLFVRRFHRHGEPQFSRAEALRIARIAVANPAARIEPEAAPERQRRRDARPLRARRPRGVRAPQAAHGADHLRRSAHPPEATRSAGPAARRRPRGCGRATASCSSTSSRTPTRSSGTSCAARSAAAASR